MYWASYPLSSHPDRGTLRRRATALVLALAANVLLVLALLTLAPALTGKPEANRKPTTFSLLPEAAEEDDASSESAAKAEQASDAVARPAPAPTPEVPAPAASPIPPPPVRLNVLNLSRDDLAATDSALQSARRTDPAPQGSGTAGDASASAMAEGGGTGPNGERLYNAEWYVRPTRAELAFYLPPGGPRTGWGMIACRTVEKYRVEDCVELGQSPPGSGFARAVRQAAWQFRVIPPRVGPKRMVGAWVRIRIEYTEGEVK